MFERIKGDKSVKVPTVIMVAAIVTVGACNIASNVCDVISKRK